MSDGKEFDQKMSDEEWEKNIIQPWENFLHKTYRKFSLGENLFKLMILPCLAQEVCAEHALADASKEGTLADNIDSEYESDDKGDDKSNTSIQDGKGEIKQSEYEIQRAKNIAENAARLAEVDAHLQAKFQIEPATAPIQSKAKHRP